VSVELSAENPRKPLVQLDETYWANTGLVKQDMQCTYNVTVRAVSAATVAVGKQRILRILSVCL
jgi:hypothetical protein